MHAFHCKTTPTQVQVVSRLCEEIENRLPISSRFKCHEIVCFPHAKCAQASSTATHYSAGDCSRKITATKQQQLQQFQPHRCEAYFVRPGLLSGLQQRLDPPAHTIAIRWAATAEGNSRRHANACPANPLPRLYNSCAVSKRIILLCCGLSGARSRARSPFPTAPAAHTAAACSRHGIRRVRAHARACFST